MHYKNGRLAQQGDKVYTPYGVGILHSVNTLGTTCNGRIAVPTQNDPYITLSECLHVDDIQAASIPDTTKAPV